MTDVPDQSSSKHPASCFEHRSRLGQTAWQLLLAGLAAHSLVACAVDTDAPSDEPLGSSQAALLLPGDVIVQKPTFPRPFPPFPLPDPEELIQISAGNAHTCVLKRNGNVYCWGRDDFGQVGNSPNATCRSAPNKCVDRPTRVYTLGGFPAASQIDAGDHHSCALDGSGKAYCWGNGDQGQVGIASVTGWFFEPLPVSGNLSFTSLSAGTMTTCGTTAAGVFCWGLPIPSNVSQSEVGRTSPTQIYAQTGLSPIGISVGYRHVCAQWVSGSYRETNCWGYDWSGQTGAPWAPYSLLGQGPNVGTAALRVATQGSFTCVDQPIGVMCFGGGGSGQLGSGITANTHLAQQVGGFAPGGTPMALHGVSTGQYHACALDPNGYAYCWGSGAWGQLGHGLRPDGYADNSSLPVAVTGGIRFKSIAAGERHTCGIGVDNLIYCWGSNYAGELGTQYKSPGQQYTNGWVADPVRTQPL